MRLGGVNEEQTIEAPTDAQPIDDLLSQFGLSEADIEAALEGYSTQFGIGGLGTTGLGGSTDLGGGGLGGSGGGGGGGGGGARLRQVLRLRRSVAVVESVQGVREVPRVEG